MKALADARRFVGDSETLGFTARDRGEQCPHRLYHTLSLIYGAKSEKIGQRLLQNLKHIPDPKNPASFPCLRCSVLLTPSICNFVAERSSAFSEEITSFAQMLTLMLQGMALCHSKIARHVFRSRVQWELAISNIIVFCDHWEREFMATSFETKHPRFREGEPLETGLSRFIPFLRSTAMNGYRLKSSQWIELQRKLSVIGKLWTAAWMQMTVCCEYPEGHPLHGVAFEFHRSLCLLLVSAAKGLWDDKRCVFRGWDAEEIRCNLAKHRKLKRMVRGQRQRHYLGFIQRHSVIDSGLFDDSSRPERRRKMFSALKRVQRECRAIMDAQYQCGSAQCGKKKSHCRYCCSRCRTVIYCSRKCQKYDWKKGLHREECPKYSTVVDRI